MTIFLICCSIL